MKIEKLLLAIIGTLYLAFGLLFLIDPQFYATKVSFPVLDTKGQIEIMAVYGGLQLVIGLAVIHGFYNDSLTEVAYLCMISLAGFFLGRLIGVMTKGLEGDHLFYLIFESILLSMSIYSYKKIGST
ncbi:MAG: hypothetical protein ACI8W8_003080 [Rhodothermales bacterium]|jgi:hypothetical protein